MSHYVLYDTFGEIKNAVSDDIDLLIAQKYPNLSLLITSQYIPIGSGYVLDNEYISYTAEQRDLKDNRPYYPAKWNNITMSWEDLRETQEKLNQQWIGITDQREQLLQQSDWRVIKASDTGVPISQAWKDYRQALRDITLQSDPFNITWPIAPTTT